MKWFPSNSHIAHAIYNATVAFLYSQFTYTMMSSIVNYL